MKQILNDLCDHWCIEPHQMAKVAGVIIFVFAFIFACICLVVAGRDGYYEITP